MKLARPYQASKEMRDVGGSLLMLLLADRFYDRSTWHRGVLWLSKESWACIPIANSTNGLHAESLASIDLPGAGFQLLLCTLSPNQMADATPTSNVIITVANRCKHWAGEKGCAVSITETCHWPLSVSLGLLTTGSPVAN